MEVRGPRVELDDCGAGYWLTWEEDVMGFMWEWKQRRMTRLEILLWRLFRRTPRIR